MCQKLTDEYALRYLAGNRDVFVVDALSDELASFADEPNRRLEVCAQYLARRLSILGEAAQNAHDRAKSLEERVARIEHSR